MADRIERVIYKVQVDTSDVPNELPVKQPGSSAVPVERGGTPSPAPVFSQQGQQGSLQQAVTANTAATQESSQVSRKLQGDLRLLRQAASGFTARGAAVPSSLAQEIRALESQIEGGTARGDVLTHVFRFLGAAGRIGGTAPTVLRLLGPAASSGLLGGVGAAGSSALAAAGPIGLAIGGAMLLQHRVNQATGIMLAGRNQMVGGALSSDPSGMIKGYAGMVKGGMHLSPLAPITDRLVDSFTHLIDALDKTSSRLAKYNGVLASSEAELQVRQVMADMRLAQAMGPTLAEWNKLKGHVLDFGNKLAVAGAKLLDLVAGPGLRNLNNVLDGLERLGPTYLQIQNTTQHMADEQKNPPGWPGIAVNWAMLLGGAPMIGQIRGMRMPAVGMGGVGPVAPLAPIAPAAPARHAGTFQSGTFSATVNSGGFDSGWQRNPLFAGRKHDGDVPLPLHGVGMAVPQMRWRPTPQRRPNEWESDFQARQYQGPHGAALRKAALDQAAGRWTPWDTTGKEAKTASATASASAEVDSKGYKEPTPPKMQSLDFNLQIHQDLRYELQNSEDLMASVRDMTERLYRSTSQVHNEADMAMRIMASNCQYGGQGGVM